ncbi:hypothetical protein H0H81_002825 [Sphagnurus paluster]|uniref:Uncharacterized protein n=1 Tax=Sphagnurus paluster TaxID=117069 RepID=A0A9P7FS96_9AGAR|nr:hypothetical protein H0H81_002825 [Sphagnurus paluster]
MDVDQAGDDQDSLFGSPPSSPIRGRSPSPALALPSASNSAQNVGTIALPGSHHCSELPVTPLALSLSTALSQLPHRPPAPSKNASHLSAQTSSSSSRASSVGPSSKHRKKSSSKKAKASTPRPPPPEIPLPDPSAPVPANFLRNQSALLGTAGLVGGIKPANLSIHRHTRGTNALNPIVVEDEDNESPVLGRPSKFRHPYSKPIDPSLLPTPSIQDVVSMLIGQKDIFPVLESILRLIASGSAPQSTATQVSSFRRASVPASQVSTPNPHATSSPSSSSSGPPPKKRKLNSVPAGAADWDVPYPFPPGQGPDSYRTTWERERGKQLISQLVTLIKSAARKAATKIYYQNEQAKKQLLESQRAAYARFHGVSVTPDTEPKVHGHYRPSTVMYGLEGEAAAAARAQAQEVLADASNGVKKVVAATSTSPYQPVQHSVNSSSTSGPQPTTPFDQLISSLVAATPQQPAASYASESALPVATPTANVRAGNHSTVCAATQSSITASTSSDNAVTTDILDSGLFDNWMNIFQTFPMPSEGFSQSQNFSQLPDQSQPASSTSMTPITNEDFGIFDFDQNYSIPEYIDQTTFESDFVTLFGRDTPTSSMVSSESQAQNESSIPHDIAAQFSQTDIAIDPTLLAISIPQPRHQVIAPVNADTPPSLAASPMPSLSSFGEADPTTPNSASWDLSMPEVFTGAGGDAPSGEKGLLIGRGHRHAGLAGQGMWGRALGNSIMCAHGLPRFDEDEYVNALLALQGQSTEGSTPPPKSDKGKGRASSNEVIHQAPLLLPRVTQTHMVTADSVALASPMPNPFQTSAPAIAFTFTPGPPTIAAMPAQRPLKKSDVLRRAMERKKQLMAEIDKVRTQLWETTIEQGVLSHMSKLCSDSQIT